MNVMLFLLRTLAGFIEADLAYTAGQPAIAATWDLDECRAMYAAEFAERGFIINTAITGPYVACAPVVYDPVVM